MRHRSCAVLASVLVTALILSGCPGSDSQPASPAPPAAPAAAPEEGGDGAGVTPVGQIDKTELKLRMMKVKQAAEAFKALEGRWPKDVQELVRGEHLSAADAKDPWDRELTLIPSGPQLSIGSLGKDGQPGGEGLDADLTSADLF